MTIWRLTGYLVRQKKKIAPTLKTCGKGAGFDGLWEGNWLLSNHAILRGGFHRPLSSEASIIAPANIIGLHPFVSLELTDRLALTLDWNFFWKHRMEDAIYAPPGRPLIRAGENSQRTSAIK